MREIAVAALKLPSSAAFSQALLAPLILGGPLSATSWLHNISSTKEFDEARKAPAELANQIDFLTEEIDSVTTVTFRLRLRVTERLKAILDGTSEGWLRVLTVFVSPSTSVSKLGPTSLSPFHRIRFRDRCDQKEAMEITEAKWELEGQLSEAKSMLSSSREEMD